MVLFKILQGCGAKMQSPCLSYLVQSFCCTFTTTTDLCSFSSFFCRSEMDALGSRGLCSNNKATHIRFFVSLLQWDSEKREEISSCSSSPFAIIIIGHFLLLEKHGF